MTYAAAKFQNLGHQTLGQALGQAQRTQGQIAAQTLGQRASLSFPGGFAGVKERASKNIALCTLGFVIALAVFIPFFALGMRGTEAVVLNLPVMPGLHKAAQVLGLFYSLSSIPVLFRIATKHSTPALLVSAGTIGSILGALFYLSV